MSINFSKIPYYHRDYSKDIPTSLSSTKDKINQKESIIKRIFIAALPFLALYNPIGIFLSVSLGSLRTIFSIKEAKAEYLKNNFSLFSKKLFLSILAIISVTSSVFKHQIGLAIANISDVIENLSISFKYLLTDQLSESLPALISAFNSSMFTAMLFYPTVEIILLSLIFQVVSEISNSIHEFKKDKYIEGFAKLLMSTIRGYLATTYIRETNKLNSNKISDFLILQRENIARIFHRASAIVASPFWWYSEKVVKIFSPIRLDKKDQCSTYLGEVASRVFYSLICIPMLPITLTLTSVEGVFRFLANMIQPNSFFYLPGLAKEKTSESLKVLTMNVCFVSGGFPRLFGGVAPWKERIDPLVNKILIEKPNVVCLLEVNDVNACYKLIESLKNQYAHFYFNIGSKTLTQNSGHFIASDHAISDMNFIPFNTGSGLQNMVNKGLFSFGVNNNDTKLADIFAVHLSPSSDDLKPAEKEIQTRENELDKVFSKIKKTDIKDPNSYKLLVGDMNLNYLSDEWNKSILSSNNFYSPYSKNINKITPSNSTCATIDMIDSYKNKTSKNWLKNPMILDQGLLYKGNLKRMPYIKSKLFKAYDENEDPYEALSDHNGQIIEIS